MSPIRLSLLLVLLFSASLRADVPPDSEPVKAARAFIAAVLQSDAEQAIALMFPVAADSTPAQFRTVMANLPKFSDHVQIIDVKLSFDAAAIIFDNGAGTPNQTMYLLVNDGDWLVLLGKPEDVKDLHRLSDDQLADLTDVSQWARTHK